MKLHIVSTPASSTSDLRAASRAAEGGAVLLIEDAVLTAVRGSPGQELLQGLMLAGARIYALAPDLEARGIAPERLLGGIGTVDYDGFVGLVEKHDVVPWL